MSLLIRTLAVVALAAAGASAQAADVGVSVQVSQPGVYGRIDIGRFPQPQVVVQQPVIIAAPPPPRAPPGPPELAIRGDHAADAGLDQHCGTSSAGRVGHVDRAARQRAAGEHRDRDRAT